MGYGLLGAHTNATVTGLPETIAKWKPPLVVLLDHSEVWHGVKKATPNTIFVGRVFHQSEPNFNDPNLDPIAAARENCDKVLPWAERMGETYDFWQGVNEPIISSLEAMQRCADFDAERARIMEENGFRVVVGSFSVGNPELALWAGFVPALEAALLYKGALALHEYAWPNLNHEWPWYLLRHRKVYDGEPQHNWPGLPDHLKTLPLLITECGLDGLIEQSHPPRGWRVLYGDKQSEYLKQLAWYAAKLKETPYVAGAAIYCCATPDSTWASYDIWPEIATALSTRAKPIYRLTETPTLPLQPPGQPVRPEQPQPSTGGWQHKTEYRPGPRLIIGSLPEPGIQITISDPWGNASTVLSGSKPEYGPGGFEVLAPHSTTYTIRFLGQSFQVETRDATAFLTFVKAPTPTVPEQPPVSDDDTPEIPAPVVPEQPPVSDDDTPETPAPVAPEQPSVPVDDTPTVRPGPSDPPEIPSEPLGEDEMIDMVMERLDRIIALLGDRL